MKVFHFLVLTGMVFFICFPQTAKTDDSLSRFPKNFEEHFIREEFVNQCFDEIQSTQGDSWLFLREEFSWSSAVDKNGEMCPESYANLIAQIKELQVKQQARLEQLYRDIVERERAEKMLRLKGHLILKDFVKNCKEQMFTQGRERGEDIIIEMEDGFSFPAVWNHFVAYREKCPEAYHFLWVEIREHGAMLQEFKLEPRDKKEKQIDEDQKALDKLYSRFFSQ